ncbi:hypothetical protein Tco_0685681 [Tanacetum coccineum]
MIFNESRKRKDSEILMFFVLSLEGIGEWSEDIVTMSVRFRFVELLDFIDVTMASSLFFSFIFSVILGHHLVLQTQYVDRVNSKMFDRAFKRVNTFIDFRTEVMEGSSKRAGTDLEQEVTKKQKVDDVQETSKVDNDQEAAKIKELMEIVPDKEEVAIDAIPLVIKPPSIVDWKIHKEWKKTYYQIIRADVSSNMYLVFSHMLKSFDREDLETLWKLVKAKHGSTRPEEGYQRVL